MTAKLDSKLPADRVLVTVGTMCGVSSVGTTLTRRALIEGDPSAIAWAAVDAGLCEAELGDGAPTTPPRFRLLAAAGAPDEAGQALSPAQIEERFGPQLRAAMGIRALDPASIPEHLPTDVGAPLPHDLEHGGLRRLSGTSFEAIRASAFRDMFGLFQNEPELGPSLQSQLFLYGGLGALSALPRPLPEILPQAHLFRVAAGCAFGGQEQVQNLGFGMQPGSAGARERKGDRLAYRLAASLNTHGPALLNTLLSPAYNLSKVRKNPELLDGLICPDSQLRNVPQAPMVVSGACASALLALADLSPQLLQGDYPGTHAPKLVLWTAADAGLQPDARTIEGFGPGAMISREKLAELNAGREGSELRSLAEALAPFDRDACGTVIGHGGSGLLVTTLRFAVEQQLDISAIITGWGQSGETGGKGHFAGVGFGGENATILALRMAEKAHGYGVESFTHLVAHATGTRTNSRTDLTTIERARRAAAGKDESARLPRMTVSAPKSLGDGHTMGEAGLRAAGEAIDHLLGRASVGVPSLKHLDPDLADCLEHFDISASAVAGNDDGGALISAQGFGGYDAAMAMRAANPDALRRYHFDDPRLLDAYLERHGEIRREREAREYEARARAGAALALAERHRWPGL
ncbi:MAG: hypothetical protein OEZ06_15570 [Myxococcales bacterium]|nr:hypothetical protein [Myxococcales bacterium]